MTLHEAPDIAVEGWIGSAYGMWPAWSATIRHCPRASNFSQFLPPEYSSAFATSRPGWYQRWYHNDSLCHLVASTSHPKFGDARFAIIRHCPLMPYSSGVLRCQFSPIFASVRPHWWQGWCQYHAFRLEERSPEARLQSCQPALPIEQAVLVPGRSCAVSGAMAPHSLSCRPLVCPLVCPLVRSA
jgi:hypothetical protein